MSKPDLLAELNYRCKNLSEWFWGTLIHYESRSVDEINLVTTHIVEQNIEDIKMHYSYWLWDDFEDSLIASSTISDIESSYQLSSFALEPKLEIAEYALAIGLVSISLATQRLLSKNHNAHIEAALCYAQALNAQSYWSSIRGLSKCRNPDPKITLVEQNFKDLELKLLESVKRIALAKKAANARHSQPGGSRDKANKVRREWATGNYQSRNQCAEKVAPKLGMSFKAARNALINTPDPK